MTRLLKTLVAGTIGFLAIVAAYLGLALYHWPSIMSNATVVALIAVPIPIGALVGVAVYRFLDR